MRESLPSLAVLIVMSTVSLAAAAAAHVLTRGLVGEDVFLKNYRALFFEESVIFHKMEYALKSEEADDVLILGDSSGFMDLDAAALEKALGRRVYNLATIGWLQVDGHLELLKAYLRLHPKPKVLVYVILPTELGSRRSSNEAFKERVLWAYGDELKRARGMTRWPLELRLREELRTLVGRLTGAGPRFARREVAPGLDHAALGRSLADRRGSFFRTAKRPAPFDLGPLDVVDEAADGLRALARFTGERGIPLLIRLGPVPRAGAPDVRRLAAWFRAFEREFPRAALDRPLILAYEPGLFSDASHLGPAGVERFTASVAARLRPLLQEKRHVKK